MNVNNVPAMVGFDDIDYSNAFSWNGIVFVKVHIDGITYLVHSGDVLLISGGVE